MPLKQDNASEDSAAVINNITALFQSINLPRLADGGLYLGVPFPVLEAFHKALCAQRCEDEEKRYHSRLHYAGIAKERTANTFKWGEDTYPFVEPGAIESALGIGFIRQRKNLVMTGPPGAGKSLLSVIIACKAIREGFSLKYKTAHNIATELREAKAGNSLSGYIKKLTSCDVLVIDDLTFATFDIKTAQSFYSVINERYGRKTTVIISNTNIKEWVKKFPDGVMISALLGRFYEEALLVNMNGAEDMRLKKAKGMIEIVGKDEGGIKFENQKL
jgi:DNA replication protein DnaC